MNQNPLLFRGLAEGLDSQVATNVSVAAIQLTSHATFDTPGIETSKWKFRPWRQNSDDARGNNFADNANENLVGCPPRHEQWSVVID
jgi:hypothetical protein